MITPLRFISGKRTIGGGVTYKLRTGNLDDRKEETTLLLETLILELPTQPVAYLLSSLRQ